MTPSRFSIRVLVAMAAVLVTAVAGAADSRAVATGGRDAGDVKSAPTDAQVDPPINRKALVARHNVVLTAASPMDQPANRGGGELALQVGNGGFAFGFDVTGLQTFYGNTMSDWGWHSDPLPAGTKLTDFALQEYHVQGRTVSYPTRKDGQEQLYSWLRNNPHRFNLGRLAMRLTDRQGRAAAVTDLQGLRQELDLWRGLVKSVFTFDGEQVTVETSADPRADAVAVKVDSNLLRDGRLTVELAFPYGSSSRSGGGWTRPDAHRTTVVPQGENRADFERVLDGTRYQVAWAWTGHAKVTSTGPHAFVLCPAVGAANLAFVCRFSETADASPVPDVANVSAASTRAWEDFWMAGGAVDLSLSTDPRWPELERRIVLSQYLMAVQAAGDTPPQESGLFNNGWAGKFHVEMQLWHQAQWALWNRWPLLERSLGWYTRILPQARATAKSQGYAGARWPKMVGPNAVESPSPTGPLLIWQQPHLIFYAELDYRLQRTSATLRKWETIVEATADFMASYATLNPATGKYDLGPIIKTLPETNDPLTTKNPSFELSYWRFGLRVAQTWRERLSRPGKPEWAEVLENLAPLPQAAGLYLYYEGADNTYTRWNFGHPSVIGMSGLLPGDGVDPAVMKATTAKVLDVWKTKSGFWGCDPPLMAMAAARNGLADRAVDTLLMDVPRNQFDANGCSSGGPYPYFPSNGSLLYAIAFMAAGWDGAPARNAPGFPADGRWHVRHEGLRRAP